jgi:hypothetical protein
MLTIKPVVLDVPPPARESFEAPVWRTLPSDLKCEIHQFQVADVAQRFFRSHRKAGLFSRQKVDFEAVASFQTDPLKAPLLQTHTKASEKAAIECFKLILAYTGVDPKAKPGQALTASKLLTLASNTPEVRDEVFFQLVKQTRGNLNRECLLKTWELFLIYATLFPASRDSERWIKGHLYETMNSGEPDISDIAQFTYIRFSTRFAIGKPATDLSVAIIQQIPLDGASGHQVFGASIHEQLWHQRKSHPRAPVPVLLHKIATALIAKGCEQWEGLFRLPGSGEKVARMQKEINSGADPFTGAEMNELASLFKSWFAKLPEPIVNSDTLPLLKTAWETKEYIQFTARLATTHVAVMKYLIGFLRRIVAAEKVTKMTPKNLAICFGPNIIDTSSIVDPMQMSQYSEMSQEFIITLITNWDVSDTYPPADGLMDPV